MHFNLAPHFEVRRLLEGGAYCLFWFECVNGAALIRGQHLIKVQSLLEEIRYVLCLHNVVGVTLCNQRENSKKS